jgi:MauM/NapG family ferredoxin protein
LGASAAGIGLLGSSAFSERKHPRLIQPPGTREKNFFQECLRCGECIYACPTGAIHPALFEAGVEGLWTPVLVPRLGYCDYSCHACGQVCPVGAIPELSLEEKREQVMGKAYIDHNRCLAWADHEVCIVCEEMCPVPDKAIYLEEVEVTGREGEKRVVKQPHVERDLCIGCGICEYKCPLDGRAAIRVYVPSL